MGLPSLFADDDEDVEVRTVHASDNSAAAATGMKSGRRMALLRARTRAADKSER